MHKRALHHLWTKLRPISQWYFFVAFIICAVVAVVALRQNNLTALHLRDQVLQVDKDNGDVEAELKDLREYVYGHMNTDLGSGTGIYPPIQLKYRYERLVEAQKSQTTADNSTKLYNDAQNFCEQQVPTGLSGRNRLSCIQQYIDSHNTAPQPKTPSIPDALYKFDFASPIWSPDLAGWSLLAAAIFLLLFIVRFVLERWLRHSLHEHN